MRDQGLVYSGYKHTHTVLWQGILTPDRLLVYACGPFGGRADDWSVMLQSGLQSELGTHSFDGGGSRVYIYDDGGYA